MASTIRIQWANFFFLASTVLLLMQIGAALWETVNVVPLMSKAPPASFHIFQGDYGLTYDFFWITTHAVIELSLITTLILNWKDKSRRKILFFVMGIYILVRIWTILYFAPTVMSFWTYPYSNTVDEALRQRVKTWGILSIIRTVIIACVTFSMIPYNKKAYSEN
jgi:hypothetical protein